MNTFKLVIASPDGNMFDGDIVKIVLRGAEGELAVLKDHIPFITSVVSGECRIELSDGTEKKGMADGGILSVSKENVTLLSSGFRFL